MIETRLLSTDELLRSVVDEVTEIRVRENSLMHKIAELDRRGVAAELGYRDLPQVLRHAVRWDLSAARRWIANAALLTNEITPTGSELAPKLPLTAEAVAEGALSIEHVAVVAEIMKTVPAEHEVTVVGYARDFEPVTVRRLGTTLAYAINQDDPEPRDPAPAPPGNQHWMRWKNGKLEISAKLDKVTGAKYEALIDPLAKPRPQTPDEGPDRRPREEREGDALAELQVRELACNAGIIPMVLGGAGQPLNVGRKTRTFPAAIRRTLVTRDRGCAFPGCGRPPRQCDAHHIKHWANGGDTSVDNAVLLCRHHHTLIHQSEWEVGMVNGIPTFYAPAWLDPQQRPRRNLVNTA
ncbi:HNH endonuclease signature motif containing protein [Lentzea aerocolonigenes]|uniref:HNH endonuclease signature motif containing protein n=1 Tax=Lentzea aerocolonigenes TaxID=68170 RepID=UPI0009DD1F91|nr:HNH endonuclease signature motif containing protein [Lentzea aerocolonigenes]